MSSTNFIGRDPMQWWIGQVTDPDKGEWGDSYERKQAEDGEDIYSLRCRVRIVGYHGNDVDLPDKDLPLAHVLLPSNTSTTGGCGKTLQYQGGEVVVGFFFDGEDGQQPVIFGTLFKQPFIRDGLKNSEFDSKKQVDFIPYTPPRVRQRAGKHRFYSKSPWPGGFSAGEAIKTIAQKQKEAATNITIDNFTGCDDNEISKISNTIKDFTRKIQTFQQLNDQNSYVDPIYGGVIDIQQEIKLTTQKLQNSTTKLVRRARSWLIQDTLDKLNLTLKDKTPKTLQAPVGQATKSLTDIIFCNIEKIQASLGDYLAKSLENMVGQVLDVPVCGVENFLADMFGQVNNIIDSGLGDTFSQLNNIQGGGISAPSATFSKAIKFANIITNVLDCDALNCPENTTYSSKNGVSKAVDDNFDSLIDKIGFNKLTDVVDSLDKAIPAAPSAPNCQTNVLKCGPPRVDFIGSSGEGASGSAVVNALGQIIGVAVNGPGLGFKEPPLVSFFDGCDKGSGAGGYARLNKDGSIADVVITNPGSDFLPNTTETDLDGNVKELTPDPNANYDGEQSFVTSLDDVVVENTGFGYDDNDTASVDGGSVASAGGTLPGVGTGDTLTGVGTGDMLTDAGTVDSAGGTLPVDATSGIIQKVGQAEIKLKIQDGLIVGVDVVNGGFGFTKLPEITINSDTGAGAKLLPVLKFTKVDDASQLAQITQDAVVTVISCIEK
jgi:hypothetical protein